MSTTETHLANVKVLGDETGVTVTMFPRRALAWVRRHGIRVRRVITDNGSGYVSGRFARLGRTASLRQLRTRPCSPRTEGKAERFIQPLLREWAYPRPYPTSQHRREGLPAWLFYYNHYGRPPISFVAATDNVVAVHS